MAKLSSLGLWQQIEKRCADLKYGTIELTLVVHNGVAIEYKNMLPRESFRMANKINAEELID